MNWYQWMSLGALAICATVLLAHFLRLIRLGKPNDFSKKSGNIPQAIVYSNTKAMIDHKESAFLHLPTYFAGMVYHIGTFVSLLLFVFFLINTALNLVLPSWLEWIFIVGLCISTLCGFSLFVKRIALKKMRTLSHADDYISNLLVTLFQLATARYLLCSCVEMYYYIIISILLLYMTVGKLKHVVYYFAARYHLGFFYGWRNVWPPKKVN
jgi:hypothetical protein